MKSSVGGFDSHAPPPFDFKGLLIYFLRPLWQFLWAARGTNSFKTRRKGHEEKNFWEMKLGALCGYSIKVYTTIILDLYNVVYFKQLLTDLCHSFNQAIQSWMRAFLALNELIEWFNRQESFLACIGSFACSDRMIPKKLSLRAGWKPCSRLIGCFPKAAIPCTHCCL